MKNLLFNGILSFAILFIASNARCVGWADYLVTDDIVFSYDKIVNPIPKLGSPTQNSSEQERERYWDNLYQGQVLIYGQTFKAQTIKN